MDIQQARELAKDETTSPEKLRELAVSDDAITRQYVVMNPNVPPDVLIKLAEQFPRQVFNNPAIDLLLLETPNLFSGTSADALCSLLKREVPERLIEYAVNSTDERFKLAVLMNPQTTPEILEQLAKNKNYQAASDAELHINFISKNSVNNYEKFVRAKIQKELVETDKSHKEILGVVNNYIKLYDHIPNCISHYLRGGIPYHKDYSQLSLSEMEKIADSGNWKELQFLGKNPNTPIPILERMFSNGNAYFYIAENPNLTVDLIHKLLTCPDPKGDIGERIGINPSTPVEILEELAESNRHHSVHSAVAKNPKTPNYILQIMVDKSRIRNFVAEALARNKNISADLLEQLVYETDNSPVLVFNHPNTPENLKSKLLSYFREKNIIPLSIYSPQYFINNSYIPGDFLDECVDKRISDIQNIQNTKFSSLKKRKQNYLSTLATIAFHPNITPNILKKILDHEDRYVRGSAILNYKIPQYITEVWEMSFLENLDQNELKTIASNFYITEEVLKELVNHKNIMISRTAASNPCASDEILEEWETSPFYREGSLEQIMVEEQRLLNRWESSISAANRLTVLLDNQTPVSILAKVSRSTSWLERYAIAQNHNTPLPILQRLTKDGNRIVRNAAKVRLENK